MASDRVPRHQRRMNLAASLNLTSATEGAVKRDQIRRRSAATRSCTVLLLVGLTLLLQQTAAAQGSGMSTQDWTFITRLVATGSSDESEPPGYKVYSAFTLEAGIRRKMGTLLTAELTVRTESREVDSLVTVGEDSRLGSIELLPVNLILQVRPFGQKSIRPYAGAGLNLTVAWEKSGVLDSIDMPGHIGPAIQAGVDMEISPNVLMNLDLRWNTLTAKLENGNIPLADLRIDPLALGIGVGFGF